MCRVSISNYLLKLAPDLSIFSEFERAVYQNDFTGIQGLTFYRETEPEKETTCETNIVRGIFMIRNEDNSNTEIPSININYKEINGTNIIEDSHYIFYNGQDDRVFMIAEGTKDNPISFNASAGCSVWGVAF